MAAFLNLSGRTFARWTVVERAPNLGRHVRWLCRCECGNTGMISSSNLVSGKSRSCGCLHSEIITTHDMTNTPEHATWISMRSRCYTKSSGGYRYYGARGIKVCERWQSFENFLADMGNRPEGHSLDRIDPHGDYSPENCRWATDETQNNNQRSSRYLIFDGKTQTVAQWAREAGLSKSTLLGRLKWGWPIEDALTWPAKQGRTNPHNVKPTP
jgi:hypothetical protein